MEKLLYWIVLKSLFWLFREEQDSEYARRIQEEIQRAAEEERKREKRDEVWKNLHFTVYGWCMSYLSDRFHTAFHLSLRHVTQFYPQIPNHWLIQGLSPTSNISAFSTSSSLCRTENPCCPFLPNQYFLSVFILFLFFHVSKQNSYKVTWWIALMFSFMTKQDSGIFCGDLSSWNNSVCSVWASSASACLMRTPLCPWNNWSQVL